MNIHYQPTYQDLTADLHIACMLGDETRVKHLLSIGAHRNAENDSGTTALELADFLHRVEIVKLLLHDINIKEAGGYELLKAIRMDHATVVRALLEMGVKEELVEDDGFFRSVLVLACCVSDTRVLGTLVKYGPGVEVWTIKDVLIQCAVAAGNMEAVEGIHDLVRSERGIESGGSMASTSNSSSTPSVSESDIEPSFYGAVPEWSPAFAVSTADLLMQSIGRF